MVRLIDALALDTSILSKAHILKRINPVHLAIVTKD